MSQTAQSRPVRKVFSTRAGGVSAAPYASFNLGDHVGDDPEAVAANRARLARAVGLSPEQIVWMEQLHTPTVTVVNGPRLDGSPVPATDALVTTTPGLALGVLVADCVPVLLSDATAGVVAAAHAGRRGARNGIVAHTIAAMVELGAVPERIHALLGPAAAGESYEVPSDLAADVESRLPGSTVPLAIPRAGKAGLDIRRGLIRQLLGLGVRDIDADPRDTISDEDFFSYRREGRTGRQAGLIWLSQEQA